MKTDLSKTNGPDAPGPIPPTFIGPLTTPGAAPFVAPYIWYPATAGQYGVPFTDLNLNTCAAAPVSTITLGPFPMSL